MIDPDLLPRLVAFRKELHRFPELGCEEYETARRVADFLRPLNPDILLEGLGGTGVAAVFEGKESGKTVMVRCELDALPIREVNPFEYASTYPGVSHKCGHDGHMTMVCGLALLLSRRRPERGRVVLLFQPSEEDGRGAVAVLGDSRFVQIRPDVAVALHNLPGLPLGQIVVKEGSFTPAVNSIIIRFRGKTSHAGEPHMGLNPALAIAETLQELTAWTVSDIEDPRFCLVTPIHIHMGEKAYGVSAGEGELHLTIRCLTNEGMRAKEAAAEQVVREIAAKHRLQVETEWTQGFFANQNHREVVGWVKEASASLGLPLLEPLAPFGFGEDFGVFTEAFPGGLFGIGAGEQVPALHNPDYDFPDALIPYGIGMFQEIVRRALAD